MAKAGRPPAGEKAKRGVIAVRATEEFRARIDAAAAASGRSMSQEIEARLEESFRIDDSLGGPEQAEILRIIQAVMDHVSRQFDRSWLEDGTAARIVASAVGRLFSTIATFANDSGELARLHRDTDVEQALRVYRDELREWEAIGQERLRFFQKAHAEEPLSEAEAIEAQQARDAYAARGPRPKPNLPPNLLAIWEEEERVRRATAFAGQIIDALLRSRGIEVTTLRND